MFIGTIDTEPDGDRIEKGRARSVGALRGEVIARKKCPFIDADNKLNTTLQRWPCREATVVVRNELAHQSRGLRRRDAAQLYPHFGRWGMGGGGDW